MEGEDKEQTACAKAQGPANCWAGVIRALLVSFLFGWSFARKGRDPSQVIALQILTKEPAKDQRGTSGKDINKELSVTSGGDSGNPA